jgi:NAD(P)-dependent dehydrogenase (short-subunit alcohol dehydrogenase family)
MGRMDGKVTLVTGSTRGIGRAVAQVLAGEGARVIVHGRNEADAEAAAAQLGAELGIGADMGDRGAVAAMIARIDATVGPVDVLVNNAGMSFRGAITRLTDADWDRVLAVNLTGPMAAIRAVVPGMKLSGGGSIVNTISNAATDKIPALSAYAAAKGGLLGLTRTLSAELSRFNIRVNAISPLAITELLTATLPDDLAREFAARGTASVESIGDATLFLASDMSRDITGLVLDVHGYPKP